MKDEVGKLLKHLRDEKKLRQRKLSRLSGVTQSYISHLEKGEREHRVTLRTVKALAKGLGVPPEIFLLPEDCQDCPAYILIEETLANLRVMMRALVDKEYK